ncbi:MAG TPA: hypothetical protein VFP25_02790 [Nitrososphaeraceae archaeon]|nr:hypothetical protein [Nitrososphaeraceae archaeon]
MSLGRYLFLQVPIMRKRKIPVITGVAMFFIVIIDLLMTRQILPYTKDMEILMFILTVVIGYGIGSWILLGYTTQISKDIRSKSQFINVMHWSVIIIQFSLFLVLLLMLVSNTGNRFLSPSIFAVSSIASSIVIGIITFKLISWYKLTSYKNLVILFYGIAALTLGSSILEDAGTKLLLVQVVQEKSPPGVTTESSFLYEPSEKYDGEIIYRIVNSDTTFLYIIPNSSLTDYNLLNSTVLPIAFGFRWIASTTLLRTLYQRVGKLPLLLWIILSLPLIFYLIGKAPGFFSGEGLSGVDEQYRYFFRLLFRIGTIAGNVLFGLAFFMIVKSLVSSKLKDYLIIAAIGDTMVGISLSTSAIQPTYGVAAHSLVMLSSYLFSFGLYLSAISISHDISLRKSIKGSMNDLVGNIGTAQMEQEIERKVTKIIQKQQKEIQKQVGDFSYEVTENNLRDYVKLAIEERDAIDDHWRKKRFDEDDSKRA